MRAKRSWPRSSVPNGCAIDGFCSRALKSMSLIATFHSDGPRITSSIIAASTNRLTTASLWRLKRRQASAHGEMPRPRRAASAVADARVEPAIQQVCDQVEHDDEAREHEGHRHDHRGVVAQDGIDQQRPDA